MFYIFQVEETSSSENESDNDMDERDRHLKVKKII